MLRKLLLAILFASLLFIVGGTTVKRGPGPSRPTPVDISFDVEDGTVTADHCASRFSPTTTAGCSSVKQAYVVPENRTLVLTQFYGRVLSVTTEGDENCDLDLEYGTSDDYITSATGVATIETGNNSTPDFKDVGDTIAVAINQTLAAGSWLHVKITQRENTCGSLYSISLVVSGLLY